MKKTAIVFLIGLVTIAFGSSLHAFGGPPGPPPGSPPHGGAFFGGPPGPPPGPPPHGGILPPLWAAPPDLIEKLKLTDDQLKEMRLAYVDFRNKTRKARMALMALHDEKRTMLISGKVNQAKLAKSDEEITKLSAEVMGEELTMARYQLSKLSSHQIEALATLPGRMHFGHRPKVTGK